MIPAPRWDAAQLASESVIAVGHFKKERLEEPAEDYTNALDRFQSLVEDMLETTVDLTDSRPETMSGLLGGRDQLNVFRYLAAPPISKDDLQILADAPSLNAKSLRSDYGLVQRVTHVVMHCLDKRRFPWVSESRQPKEAEKVGAVLASASLMAYQYIQTNRRSLAKTQQENMVEQELRSLGFVMVKRRRVRTHSDAPAIGEYCRESKLGTRKADFIVRNWDGRILAIECKVSNSALNSVKRLNNDAGSKAAAWVKDFGESGVVPIALLSGVYKVSSLEEAQSRGLALFWAHSMADFSAWINRTKV